MKIFRQMGLVMAILSFTAYTLQGEPGVSATQIKLGQSAVLDGPAKSLGLGMRTGLQICFQEINAHDGIHGRTILLESRDDGYEPDRAAANATELIQKEEVFALIGGVGTPTSAAVIPLCTEKGVPYIGALTGANALRRPFNPLVINLRASYAQEMERLVHLLVDERKLEKIACFHQDDAFGIAGLNALQLALKKRKMDLIATGVYPRNTTNINAAAGTIRQAEPQAIVLVGTYSACAEYTKFSHKLGLKKTLFCNISFVGTRALIAALGEEAEGVIISQVMPYPEDARLPLVRDYLAALKKYAPDSVPDWNSLEGYAVGRLFAAIATQAGADLTRASFLAALAAKPEIDLGGLKTAFGPENNQGLNEVNLTWVKDGKVVPFD